MSGAVGGPVLRVGFDLDDVVYPFDAVFRGYLLSSGWLAGIPVPRGQAAVHPGWGIPEDEMARLCTRAVDAGVLWWTGAPLPGAAEAMRRMMAAGHEVHIVTARTYGTGDGARYATRSWLARNRMPYTSLTFSQDKTIVRCDTFVDDSLDNYRALEAAGVRAYLADQPWNAVPGGDRYRRVTDVGQYADRVLALTATDPVPA